MKRTRIMLFTAIFALLLCTLSSCSDGNATTSVLLKPPKPEKEVNSIVKSLAEIGFINSRFIVEARTTENKERWASKGFEFKSFGEVNSIMMDNNFILGPSNKYIGNITSEAVDKIVKSYNILKPKQVYRCIDGRTFTATEIADFPPNDANWVVNNSILDGGVDVLAPVEKFDITGMDLRDRVLTPKGKDPIALLRVKDGYIVLAVW